jgi:hypothetical protein
MVIPSPINEFYPDTEVWALKIIRACQESIALMEEVREQNPGDWEIEELTRAIMFDEAQMIKSLRMEAESARAACQKLKRV